MARSSTTTSNRKPRGKLDTELDKLLGDREQLEATIAAAEARRAKKIAKAERRYQKDVGKAPTKLEKLDKKLTAFLERHRYWLTRRHGKTIVRANGEVKEILRAIEMDTPATEKDAVDLLLARPGGKKYLVVTYKLNRRALLRAPGELRAALKPLGFWWGKHRTISVKSTSSKAPKQLSRRRFNER